eukprot:5712186-Pyramimonas_sp.AAC.1
MRGLTVGVLRFWKSSHTVEAHAKRLPACLQGALGLLGFDGWALEGVTFPHQEPMDVLGSQGRVSFGRFLVDGPPLYPLRRALSAS